MTLQEPTNFVYVMVRGIYHEIFAHLFDVAVMAVGFVSVRVFLQMPSIWVGQLILAFFLYTFMAVIGIVVVAAVDVSVLFEIIKSLRVSLSE